MGKYRFEDLSKDDLRRLVQSLEDSDIPIFLIEPDSSRLVFANSAWLNHADRLHKNFVKGLSLEEALRIETDALAPHLPENIRQSVASEFANTARNGGVYEFGAPDGKLFRGNYTKSEPDLTLGISFDVTEIKQKRSEAKKARSTLQATLDGLHHGVMLYDETGHVSYFNESFRATAASLGITIEKGLFHKSLRDQLPDNIKARLTADGRRDLENFEFIQQTSSGNYYLFEGRRLPNNTMLVSTVDVSELETKKAETKKARIILEKTLEGLPHGVLLYNHAGRVEFFNSRFASLTDSMNMNVEIGMSFLDVSAQLPKSFKEELLGHEPGQAFEVIQKRADGGSFLVEGHPIGATGFLLTIVDITEMQNALEAAKAADIAKTSFLANMSHEIRTPMNGVLGMAQVLEQTAIDEHQQKCVDIIKNSSEMLLRIINDILDISKLDAEKVELDIQPMDIESTIRDAINIVKPKLRDNPNVEIINDCVDMPKHWHMGDKGRLRQILINLIGNGVKFTAEGHVKISTQVRPHDHKSDRITIRIEDTGIGIPDSKREKIFERFEQNDMSTTRVYGGTGLGLSISKKLIEIMGGRIKLCPEKTNGACFEIAFPANRCPREVAEEKPVRQVEFKNTPVLVIDDNPVNHMVLSNQLKPLQVKPYCVTSAKNGLNILQKMAEKNIRIPLVICDYQMPEMTGYDFVKAVKQDPALAQTPIIILSSADITARRRSFMDMGVDHVIEKPCSNNEILGAVLDTLQHSVRNKRSRIKDFQHAAATSETTMQKGRILVADDDPVNRDVFAGMLKMAGYKSDIVENGLEALKRFGEQHYDFILMDISMPVLNGMEATSKIRALEKREGRKKTPIIAVTAHALKGDREKFLAHGMDDYLAKPILKDPFEAVLRKWSPVDRTTALAS